MTSSKNTLRKAVETDAPHIHDAHMRSIREVCSKDHTPEEIEGWGNRPFNEPRWISSIRNDDVWVIEIAGKIEGYAHLRISKSETGASAYINGLYLAPKALGKGFGNQLASLMLKHAQEALASQISLEATLTAHGFYTKFGFIDNGPLTTVQIGGSSVRCQPMILKLNLKS